MSAHCSLLCSPLFVLTKARGGHLFDCLCVFMFDGLCVFSIVHLIDSETFILFLCFAFDSMFVFLNCTWKRLLFLDFI